MRLWNKLLLARIQYLDRCQQEGTPIHYERIPAEFYKEAKDREVVKAFAHFIQECGESPHEYRCLLRIAIPEDCEELFAPPLATAYRTRG
ncbi:MAG: hypothetical protein ACR2PX_06825 [Endozoicomonas sp.]|uniref:hypothetical protein n=1 Tax=Endozoicomonas sp. TaxID=1892382 RepID=UPI003D9B9D62